MWLLVDLWLGFGVTFFVRRHAHFVGRSLLFSFFFVPHNLTLNSCSRKLRRRNSHDNSKAVNIGSFDDNDIKLGLAKARYALMRDRECRNESSNRDITHSSQPHLHS